MSIIQLYIGIDYEFQSWLYDHNQKLSAEILINDETNVFGNMGSMFKKMKDLGIINYDIEINFC